MLNKSKTRAQDSAPLNLKRQMHHVGTTSENEDLWHLMTLEEKKRAAHRAGLRISDWEAMQNIQSALEESRKTEIQIPIKSQSFVDKFKEEDEEKNTSDSESEEEMKMLVPFFDDFETEEERRDIYKDNGSFISSLPNYVQHHVCQFLEIDDICQCSIVSLRWHFARDEELFKYLCHKTYLCQGKKKQLNPKRWRGWRNMFIWRPRVRTNGFYMLRKSHVRKPQLDMWTEVKRGEIVETVYYRYFKFDAPSSGEVLYSLLHCGPNEAVGMLNPHNRHTTIGRYTVHKKRVQVEVETAYASIYFELELETGWKGGHFTKMILKEHRSAPASLGPNARQIPHETKDECFYFYRQS